MKILKEIDLEKKIKEFFKGTMQVNAPLKAYTSIKIGGTAKFLFIPCDIDDLSNLVNFLNSLSIPIFIIGGGSNLLISDEHLEAAVVKLDAAFFNKIYRDGNTVFCGAGVLIAKLVEFTKNEGLSGCEFLAGIPGTVGGALVMNAGVRGLGSSKSKEFHWMADILKKVQFMDKEGNLFWQEKEKCEFGYRHSNLKENIILGACFKLKPEAEQNIKHNFKKFIERKRMSQELSRPNAGCMFKNPEDSPLTAGELIDRCQLKGRAIGDAQISSIHANFIINCGRASFQQVKALMQMIKDKVYTEYSVRLKEEVEIWEKTV